MEAFVSRGNPWQHSLKTRMGGDGVGRSLLSSAVLEESKSAGLIQEPDPTKPLL